MLNCKAPGFHQLLKLTFQMLHVKRSFEHIKILDCMKKGTNHVKEMVTIVTLKCVYFFSSAQNSEDPEILQQIGQLETFIGLITQECTGSVIIQLTGQV